MTLYAVMCAIQVLAFSDWFVSELDESEMNVLRKKVNWSRLGLTTSQGGKQQEREQGSPLTNSKHLQWGKKAFPGKLEIYLHKYTNDIRSSSRLTPSINLWTSIALKCHEIEHCRSLIRGSVDIMFVPPPPPLCNRNSRGMESSCSHM